MGVERASRGNAARENRAHDTGRFEIFCYYNQVRGDEVTARIRACAEHFIPVAGLPDSQLAGQVNNDAIDILIDLNGHTADNRLPMFFLRPAPLQLTWLGYPGTTGVSAIDYRVTDVYADPPGITDKLHVEALWRLPARTRVIHDLLDEECGLIPDQNRQEMEVTA